MYLVNRVGEVERNPPCNIRFYSIFKNDGGLAFISVFGGLYSDPAIGGLHFVPPTLRELVDIESHSDLE